MTFTVTTDFLEELKSLACIICIRAKGHVGIWWWKESDLKQSCILAKIGKKEYLERLLEYGEVYMNSIVFFRNHSNPEIGDSYEGALYVKNGQVCRFRKNLDFEKVFCVMDLKGLLPKRMSFWKHNNYIDEMVVRFAFNLLNGFLPNEDLFVVVIKDVQEFNIRFKKACKRTKVHFLDNRPVVYYDEFDIKPNVALSSFMKRLKYQKQHEVRYLVYNLNVKPLKLYLGSLCDIAYISNVNDLCFELSSIANCA